MPLALSPLYELPSREFAAPVSVSAPSSSRLRRAPGRRWPWAWPSAYTGSSRPVSGIVHADFSWPPTATAPSCLGWALLVGAGWARRTPVTGALRPVFSAVRRGGVWILRSVRSPCISCESGGHRYAVCAVDAIPAAPCAEQPVLRCTARDFLYRRRIRAGPTLTGLLAMHNGLGCTTACNHDAPSTTARHSLSERRPILSNMAIVP